MKSPDNLKVRPDDAPLRSHLSDWLRAAGNASTRVLAMVERQLNASDSEATCWTDALGPVIDDLDLLNRNTEQDFLTIGGKLSEFIGAVNLISSDLRALADSQNGLRAASALTNSLEFSAKMSARGAGRRGGLESMRQEVGRLRQTLTGFHGTVLTFHTLGLLTRIESARLGAVGAQFSNLADDMKSVAANVQARVERALDIADSLLPPIEDAIQRISAIEDGQAKDLPAVISTTQASLSSLRNIQALANESSVRLGSKYQAISAAFKKLIVSVQFHDITRQQVEHVVEVLRRLRSRSDGEDGAPIREEQGAAAVLALQSLQLGDAGQKFGASVASVTRSLDVLKQNITEMVEESQTLSGLSGNKKTSSLLEMERGCTSILASLTHHAGGELEMKAVGGVLAETVIRMHGFMKEIQAIEIEMHLMAVNASICAAHIGTSGDALGALASSMQQRAADSRQRSDSLIQELDCMSKGAIRLAGEGESVLGDGQDIQNGYMEEMRTAVAELHSSSERSSAQTAQILASGTRLGEDLSSTRETFTVGALFANAVSSAQQKLKAIEEKTPSSLSHEGGETSGPVLAEFATHYTMQAERDVHEGITRALGEAVPIDVLSDPSEFPPIESNELGDNVEFF